MIEYEEVLPCGSLYCDVYLLKPGKVQCSFENTTLCLATSPYPEDIVDRLRTATLADSSDSLYALMTHAADEIEALRSALANAFKSNEDDHNSLPLQPIIDRLSEKYSTSVDIDEGWYEIALHCNDELAKIDPDYTILQIKQKFGELRYYFQPSSSATEEMRHKMLTIVLLHESKAKKTCEATGGAGVLMKSPTGYYRTLNPEYAANTSFFSNYTIVSKNSDIIDHY